MLGVPKKSSGQFKASHFLRSKKVRPFKLRADLGVICFLRKHERKIKLLLKEQELSAVNQSSM